VGGSTPEYIGPLLPLTVRHVSAHQHRTRTRNVSVLLADLPIYSTVCKVGVRGTHDFTLHIKMNKLCGEEECQLSNVPGLASSKAVHFTRSYLYWAARLHRSINGILLQPQNPLIASMGFHTDSQPVLPTVKPQMLVIDAELTSCGLREPEFRDKRRVGSTSPVPRCSNMGTCKPSSAVFMR